MILKNSYTLCKALTCKNPKRAFASLQPLLLFLLLVKKKNYSFISYLGYPQLGCLGRFLPLDLSTDTSINILFPKGMLILMNNDNNHGKVLEIMAGSFLCNCCKESLY